MFENPTKTEIDALLKRARTVAIIGLSNTPGRSHKWPGHYKIRLSHRAESRCHGNPRRAFLTGPGVRSPTRVRSTLVAHSGDRNVAIVDDAIRLAVPALWLQDGVIDEAAARRARAAGIFTVMNRCMFRDRSTLAA
jgi:predicted CoA-binding protein